jgi:hypothetical protein
VGQLDAFERLPQEMESLQALRGLALVPLFGDDDDDDGLPGGGAGACCVISSFVIASSGSDAVEDMIWPLKSF